MIKIRSHIDPKLINCLRKLNINQIKKYTQKRHLRLRLRYNSSRNKEKPKNKNIKMAHKDLENKSNRKKEKLNLEKDVLLF